MQIWFTKAILDIGDLLGQKLDNVCRAYPRYANWTGIVKVSYEEIILLEETFESEGVLYPYISWTENFDLSEDADFVWIYEILHYRVDRMNVLIKKGNDWSDHIWGFLESIETQIVDDDQEEAHVETETVDNVDEVRTPNAEDSPIYGSTRSRKRLHDHGAEKQKHRVLSRRSTSKQGHVDDKMQSFI